MKKIVLLFGIIISNLVYSQMAVYDAGANAQMGQQLASSAKQLTELQKSYRLMQEAADKYKTVSGFVRQMGQIQNIINLQKQAINSANKIVSVSRKRKINMNFGIVDYNLNIIKSTIANVRGLLQNNIFKMSDSERINIINREYEKAQEANSNLKTLLIQTAF